MKKYILLTILLSILLIPSVNSANVTTETHFDNDTLVTGTERTIGHFTVTNLGNVTQNNINYDIRQLPFNTSFSPETIDTLDAQQNVTLTITVPKYFDPDEYTGELIVSNDNFTTSNDFMVTVNETNALSINEKDFTENVSVGTDGKLGTITLISEGNIRNDVEVNVTGNITEHLLYNELVSIYPGHEKDIIFEYQIDKETDFGTYVGNVTLTGNEKILNETIETLFLDTIEPKYTNTKIQSFMATKPSEFSIEATDNLEVTTINATVKYNHTYEVNNTTYTETKIYETLDFEKRNNSNVWTATPSADRIGEYKIYGKIYDSSANVVKFNDTYRIRGLDVTEIDESIEFERYKHSNLVSIKIGSVSESTDLTFGLLNFNQPLSSDNETWQVAIGHGDQKRFFEEKTDQVKYEDIEGDILLYVYGSEADRYNGKIKINGIKQHVEINDLTFSGEFVNYTVPKDSNFRVSGNEMNCTAVKSEKMSEAGANCNMFIPANKLQDNSLEDLVMIPKTFYDEEKYQWEATIDEKESKITFSWTVIKWMAVILGILGYLFVYVWKYLPSTYGTYLKDTETLK